MAETQSSDEVPDMEEREGKSGRCMAGAPNVAAPTREPFLVVTLDGAKARLLVGLAAFVSWTNLLICFEGLLRDTVIYGGGVVRDPFFVAACVLAATGLIAAALWPGPRKRVAEEGEGCPRRWRRFLAAAAVLGAACAVGGVALSALATSNGPGMWLLATVL